MERTYSGFVFKTYNWSEANWIESIFHDNGWRSIMYQAAKGRVVDVPILSILLFNVILVSLMLICLVCTSVGIAVNASFGPLLLVERSISISLFLDIDCSSIRCSLFVWLA